MTELEIFLTLLQLFAPYIITVIVLVGMVLGYGCHIVYEEIEYQRIKRKKDI